MRKAIKILFRLKRKFFSFSRKKRLLVIMVIIFGLFLFGMLINLLSLNRQDLALMELRKSFISGDICHENCLVRRVELKKLIANKLTGASSLDRKIEKYFNSEGENINFRKELIEIIYLDQGDKFLPDYFSDYLNNPEGSIILQIKIVSTFTKAEKFKPFLKSRLKKIVSDRNNDEEYRLEALRGLGSVGDGALSDYYLSLLLTSNSFRLQRLSIIIISNIKNKERYFSLNQLNRIEELALLSETDKRIRQALVTLLSDYYLIFPKESTLVLENIYSNTIDDEISKMFIADFLNNMLGREKYPLPEIDQAEWDDHYSN